MSQIVQIILYVFAALLLAIIILGVVDYYLFSWTGFLLEKADICSHKSVSNSEKLSTPVDTQFIKEEMRKNPNYKINDMYQSGSGVHIQRKFGYVNYTISFKNPLVVELRTSPYLEKDSPNRYGEPTSTPNYYLRKNVFTMIEDLPITDFQKKEIKKSLWVIPEIRPGWIF